VRRRRAPSTRRAHSGSAAGVGRHLQPARAGVVTKAAQGNSTRHVSLGEWSLCRLRQIHRIVAQGIVNRIVPSSPFALGIVRFFVHGIFLFDTVFTSYSALGSLPPTILRPTGVMKFLPWSFFDALQTHSGMLTLKTLMLLSLLLSTAGFLTVISTKISLLLVLFYQGLLRSFGHFNHDEMIVVYFMVVLAFTPCGDAFSLDSRFAKTKTQRPAFAYAYPILLMQLLLAWVYFSS